MGLYKKLIYPSDFPNYNIIPFFFFFLVDLLMIFWPPICATQTCILGGLRNTVQMPSFLWAVF